MKVIENETAVTESSEIDDSDVNNNYQTVRYNALQHGILSRSTVLPHENAEEFSELLAALIAEHNPSGATERILVEELTAIIWRKRRVLLAEGATINRGIKSVVDSSFDSPIPAAVPFERGLSKKSTDLLDLLTASKEEIAERLEYADKDLTATHKAMTILNKGGVSAYEQALKALLSDSVDWWDELVDDEEFPTTAEGLNGFINQYLEPFCVRTYQEVRFANAIKTQTLGEGLQAHRLINLTRYETHLDRKFERTLAMLLKMKELNRDE